MRQQQLEEFDVEQGTEEWLELRLGMPTTSNFRGVLAASDEAENYMRRLAAERMTGEPSPQHVTAAMERGKRMEPEVRAYYETFIATGETRRIGFLKRGPIGCSPDLLVGDDGMAEFKTAEPAILFEDLERAELTPGYVPNRFLAQCQGGLWVSGRQWCDLVVYWHLRMPKLVVRIQRDADYIKRLSNDVLAFELRLRRYVERWRDK